MRPSPFWAHILYKLLRESWDFDVPSPIIVSVYRRKVWCVGREHVQSNVHYWGYLPLIYGYLMPGQRDFSLTKGSLCVHLNSVCLVGLQMPAVWLR
jgi:hypothetical protein